MFQYQPINTRLDNGPRPLGLNQIMKYLIINHLFRFAVLPQHREELNDIGILGKKRVPQGPLVSTLFK